MRFHPIQSVALAYLDLEGKSGPSAEPVNVYLGGIGSSGIVTFAPVVGHPAVAGRGRHILVDFIGSGWSDHDDTFGHTIEDHAATVIDLLESLRTGPVRLIGHSMGGAVAIALTGARPDLVRELIVAEPNLDPGVGSFSVEVSALGEDELVAGKHAEIVEKFLAEGRAGDPVAEAFGRTLKRWSSRGLHRTAVSLLAERTPTFRRILGEAGRPRRYVTGELSTENLDQVRDAGVEVRVVAGAGHAMMWDNLDGFVVALFD